LIRRVAANRNNLPQMMTSMEFRKRVRKASQPSDDTGGQPKSACLTIPVNPFIAQPLIHSCQKHIENRGRSVEVASSVQKAEKEISVINFVQRGHKFIVFAKGQHFSEGDRRSTLGSTFADSPGAVNYPGNLRQASKEFCTPVPGQSSSMSRQVMMVRIILATLACSVISYTQVSSNAVTGKTVMGTYHFTTQQTAQGWKEAATIVRTVASVPQVSADIPTATLTFDGPAEAVDFAEWLLPQIDKATGDEAFHEYGLPSGDVGRVLFIPDIQTPQAMQELLTILRTVADVQKIFSFTSNHALVLRGPAWQVAFAAWIVDEANPGSRQKDPGTSREFTVGGPDYRGMGHGARVNFLSNMTSSQQTQELLTVLRTVSDVQKIFSYSTSHALILRADDTDLKRAEWIIQRLDLPAGQSSGATIFTAPAGDDVTRIFQLRNSTPQWTQSAVTGLRSDVKITKVFATTSPANVVVRGTTDQLAAAMKWMTLHNALFE